MSKLEAMVRPIIVPLMHGEKTILTPSDRLIIVRWFLKTAILYEFLGGVERGPDKFFNPQERHALMRSLSVPESTLVFLGRYQGSLHITTREMRLPFEAQRRDDNRTFPAEGYSITFALKQLAMQVFSVRWPDDPEIDRLDISLSGPDWDQAVIQIWPSEGSVIWPPPYHFDDHGLDIFTRRWTTVVRPSSGS